MEPRPDFFPVYVSGQYLTSEHLNETQNFLWQQEKATRYILAGNGIVSGMTASITGNPFKQVIVAAGGSSTVDGFIIAPGSDTVLTKGAPINLSWYKLADKTEHLMEKTAFDQLNLQVQSVTVLNAVELFTDAVPVNELPDGTKALDGVGITNTQAMNDYIVLAWLFSKDAENNHCQQGDCNSKGIQRNLLVRYFLIKNAQVPHMNSMSAELPTCSVKRIKKLSDSGSVTGFNKKSFDAWSASVAELKDYFTSNATGKQLGIITNLLSTDEQTLLTTTINRFNQINSSVTQASCSQYYNLFAGDLSKAINELVVFYNDYSKKYHSIGESRMESCIIIGGFQQPAAFDFWRYYFIPAPPQQQHVFDKKKLKALVLRLFAMVNNFTLQSAIGDQVKLVASRPQLIPSLAACDSLLQNNSIPYYYNVIQNGNNNDVLRNWNVQGGSLRNIYCYFDSKIPGRDTDMAPGLPTTDWYNFNFFRIEGHVGMAKAAAISAVTNIINSLGVPIQLLDCDINYKGPKKWNDWYVDYTAKVAQWVKDLRKNYTEYTFDPMKNIHETITQTSYRSIDDVVKSFNDFSAFAGVMYKGPPAAGGAPNAIKAKAKLVAKNGVPDTAYAQFVKVIPQKDYTDLVKGYKDAVAAQGDAQTTNKLLVLSDLYDLEYMGGALRGGTFILLHDGTNIIGDGCLPYYYRVGQERVYNP